MGQRQDQDEIEYGNDCLTCFPEGQTPKYVYARFSEIVKCSGFECLEFPSPPNDRVFKLTQRDSYPCQWEYTGSLWHVHWFAVDSPPYGSSLLIDHLPSWYSYFSSRTATPEFCKEFFDNEEDCTEGTCGHGGWGLVTWRTESIGLLALLNIETADDLFMEMQPLENQNRVYKYCRLQDATNVKILYSPV